MTPRDEYAFIGRFDKDGNVQVPLFRPEAEQCHISCSFTWDIPKAYRLAEAWGQYYPIKVGGCALDSPLNGFVPGMYIRQGVTFTSRGCNNQCPWCLVPEREGLLQQLPVIEGNLIQDNNLLQCNRAHLDKVFNMLRMQRQVQFTGGLDSRLLTDRIADEIRSLRVSQVFLAADTKASLKPLEKAIKRLVLPRDKIRCYVLLAFKDEPMSDGLERLKAVWELGAMPFAQLYQPPDRWIKYSREWRALARTWSRPAAMKALHRSKPIKV